jgi:mannose-6-phosphate isomerase
LFDYGRHRELHLDGAVGAATAGPAAAQMAADRLSDARLILSRSPYFVLEQVDFAPNSYWEVDADRETWLLLLEGEAKFDRMQVSPGEAVYLDGQCSRIRAGARGAKGLMAYVASEPVATLLRGRNSETREASVGRVPELAARRPVPQSLVDARGIRP